IPKMKFSVDIKPITTKIVLFELSIKCTYMLKENHMKKSRSENFWVWVEDPENNLILFYEYLKIPHEYIENGWKNELKFFIPIHKNQSNLFIKVTSDRFINCGWIETVNLYDIKFSTDSTSYTSLLDLTPLSTSVIKESQYQSVFPFDYFNPIQTQCFHSLMHTDKSILIGAPTGSGKTFLSLLALLRMLKQNPSDSKCIFISPMKALVREQYKGFSKWLKQLPNITISLLTGESDSGIQFKDSRLVITTPEKWDAVTRNKISVISQTKLIIIDEVHLLGEDRGAVLESIVAKYSSDHGSKCRFI
ncbi:MAG: activating signal cointegrator 1 complex subunit, partial [Paramarteilia canceri]